MFSPRLPIANSKFTTFFKAVNEPALILSQVLLPPAKINRFTANNQKL